ncbi:DUF6555 family protein [Pseudomonas urethralis]|uniref:DUF6555 family protein n=1 Tax=Pseudomonas urethralis TaxID=2740517 RepID=UPI001F1E9D40|nr:DUF6555 family protein [Pseudomonas urethralis]
MPGATLFTVEYHLHGKPRSFVLRLESMNDAAAWNWAACDAGVAVIPKFGGRGIRPVGKDQAERYGISLVNWRKSDPA